MSPSDYAAWYAATVATLGVALEIFRHVRSGPRLRVEAVPNSYPLNVHPSIDGRPFVSVTVTNIGDAPTTITAFGGRLVPGVLERAKGANENDFMVFADPITGSTVPHVLKPGDQWHSLADQAEILKHADKLNVFIGVRASHSNKLHTVRVELPRRTSASRGRR